MAASARARAARLVMLALPSVIVLGCVAVTLSIAVAVQAGRIRDETAQRVHEVAASLSDLSQVRGVLTDAAGAGTDHALADAAALAPATAALQPVADLVERAAGVYYVVITDDEGVRITHPVASQRGVRVETTTAPVLAGEEFLGTETGPSGPSLRAKVPVRGDDGRVLGMVAVGVLESRIADERDEAIAELLPWSAGALLAGTLASSVLAAVVGRRFRRLDAVAAQHEQMRHTTAVLREQAHEFHTRLHVIHGLVSHGDRDEALQYIEGIVPVRDTGEAEGSGTGGSFLRATVEALRAELAAFGTRLEAELDVETDIDEGVLLVLSNLCRNAAEAGASLVRCTLRREGDRLVGTVEDDGPGVSPRDSERVFDRGYSSKADPSGAGRGIGLDLVRRTIGSRGGTIEVGRSRLGGARFAFEIEAGR